MKFGRNLSADEILDLSKGPLKYAGWSTCYRKEAGSAELCLSWIS